jgi:hypothetical protein
LTGFYLKKMKCKIIGAQIMNVEILQPALDYLPQIQAACESICYFSTTTRKSCKNMTQIGSILRFERFEQFQALSSFSRHTDFQTRKQPFSGLL